MYIYITLYRTVIGLHPDCSDYAPQNFVHFFSNMAIKDITNFQALRFYADCFFEAWHLFCVQQTVNLIEESRPSSLGGFQLDENMFGIFDGFPL